MAKEDDLDLDTEGGGAAPKSKSKLLIIVIIVVLLLGVSAAATLLLTGVLSDDDASADAAAQADGAGKEEPAKAKAPINYIPMDPPFVVNFSGDSDIRFLQVTVEVGTREADMIERIKEQRPAIRNNLVLLFSNQDPEALDSREGKEKLRVQALEEIQKVMTAETGKPAVESVFFTSFVMQ